MMTDAEIEICLQRAWEQWANRGYGKAMGFSEYTDELYEVIERIHTICRRHQSHESALLEIEKLCEPHIYSKRPFHD